MMFVDLTPKSPIFLPPPIIDTYWNTVDVRLTERLMEELERQLLHMVRVAQPEDFKSFLSPDGFWCLVGGSMNCDELLLLGLRPRDPRDHSKLTLNDIVISFNLEPQLFFHDISCIIFI